MKKLLILSFLSIILVVFVGCSNNMKEPPHITITISDIDLGYTSRIWDGQDYLRINYKPSLLESKDIPYIDIGSTAKVVFKSNPPDELKIVDLLIDEEGKQIYTDKEIMEVPVSLNVDTYSFKIDKNMASMLSSKYEPDKMILRQFNMIASWGDNKCEYVFVIKTK
jgi:hypothetical protein